jgi:hypothetical protein
MYGTSLTPTGNGDTVRRTDQKPRRKGQQGLRSANLRASVSASIACSGRVLLPDHWLAGKFCRGQQKNMSPGEEDMGILDHRRTWHYEVAASPAECIRAFAAAFNGKVRLGAKANWSVRAAADSATATYEGRAGIGAIASALSQTSAQEGDTAIGSQVSFKVEGSDGGRTQCSMWLASSGRSGIAGLFGATSDARSIRPYMQAVGRELLKLDPQAQIQSS